MLLHDFNSNVAFSLGHILPRIFYICWLLGGFAKPPIGLLLIIHELQFMTDYRKLSLDLHRQKQGKLSIQSKFPLETIEDLSIAYTPGVAEPCRSIHKDVNEAKNLTIKGNSVAVVSDGSAVLGLGDIGPEASLPVMEGKCLLFKKFAGIDAMPVVLAEHDIDKIVDTVMMISPTYGGINLEDISAPACFEVEERLKEICSVPVMHDDQHGTAVVTLAGLINTMRLTGKELKDCKFVINGAGAAGVAIIKLLHHLGAENILMLDSKGIIYQGRENLNGSKNEIAGITNPHNVEGDLKEAIAGSDVFIGVSAPEILSEEMVRSMNEDPVIFAMANPVPEIMPDKAKEAGARIIATGRSDFPNQVNNVLAFPGLFRGILDSPAKQFTRDMFIAAAEAIADSVDEVSPEKIIPSPFQEDVAGNVAQSVRKVADQQAVT